MYFIYILWRPLNQYLCLCIDTILGLIYNEGLLGTVWLQIYHKYWIKYALYVTTYLPPLSIRVMINLGLALHANFTNK